MSTGWMGRGAKSEWWKDEQAPNVSNLLLPYVVGRAALDMPEVRELIFDAVRR